MTAEHDQALPVGTRLGDYRLDALIGHGGFGITYRAFDTQLAKFVAIKEYMPVEFATRRADGQVAPRGSRFADDFTWGRERFLDEARALARFRHVHIVPVLRYFEANGTAYTVMEFEDGHSVAQLLRQPGRRLQPDEIRRLTDGMLSGLGAVHAQGFLHRDIKPSNVIVRRDGVPILIDFGAARQAMGGRTRTLTSILTPQYAPIEQYAMDGKQGPWTDIYATAAVLHHTITGSPPPEAVSRVGTDPYRPLAATHADRFDPAMLSAIDRGLAFAPEHRPQSIAEWRTLFGGALPRVEDAPTQRMTTEPAPAQVASGPRLGGASRSPAEEPSVEPPVTRRKGFVRRRLPIVLLVLAAVGIWKAAPQLRERFLDTPKVETQASLPSPVPIGVPTEPSQGAATPTPVPPAATTPAQAPPKPPVPAPGTSAQKARADQATRAATEARAVFDRAEEAARAARAMAGEARIVAARAALPDLENSERLTYGSGASYVGQVVDGKRQGLGVAELGNGERQAGDWSADLMNGLGTVRLGDDTRYAGQWKEGKSTGLGLREKPGAERSEGNFVGGRLEGLGLRRTLADPNVVQAGEFHGDLLDGPGVERIGERERYEGGFRGGQRNGYGQVTDADGKMRPGRWADGKLVEPAP